MLSRRYSFEYVCLSSMGSCWVRPRALPRGMMVTLWMGSELRRHLRDERMSRFMVGRVAPLCVRDDHAPPLDAHEHLVLCLFEVGDLYLSSYPSARR